MSTISGPSAQDVKYRGARPLTPFITLGLGLAYADAKPDHSLASSLQLGGGLKYKVADRLNLTAEWVIHFTGSDLLDGVADPYGIKSSGLFKNTDGYTSLMITATYSFNAKCRTCHNEDE